MPPNLKSAGMWPQLWVVLRICAELLLERDPATAAVFLAAAEAPGTSSALLEPEVERQARLWSLIAERLDPEVVMAARREGSLAGRAGAAVRAAAALAALEQRG